MNPTHPPSNTGRQKTPPPYYDCANCRYSDAHGLVCGVCLRKILDEQAEQRLLRAQLIAACFDSNGVILVRATSV